MANARAWSQTLRFPLCPMLAASAKVAISAITEGISRVLGMQSRDKSSPARAVRRRWDDENRPMSPVWRGAERVSVFAEKLPSALRVAVDAPLLCSSVLDAPHALGGRA